MLTLSVNGPSQFWKILTHAEINYLYTWSLHPLRTQVNSDSCTLRSHSVRSKQCLPNIFRHNQHRLKARKHHCWSAYHTSTRNSKLAYTGSRLQRVRLLRAHIYNESIFFSKRNTSDWHQCLKSSVQLPRVPLLTSTFSSLKLLIVSCTQCSDIFSLKSHIDYQKMLWNRTQKITRAHLHWASASTMQQLCDDASHAAHWNQWSHSKMGCNPILEWFHCFQWQQYC